MNMRSMVTPSYLSLVYLFFYIPIIVLIVYSFNHAQYSLIWHGFTLRWYTELFADSDLWLATGHSLLLGAQSFQLRIASDKTDTTGIILYIYDYGVQFRIVYHFYNIVSQFTIARCPAGYIESLHLSGGFHMSYHERRGKSDPLCFIRIVLKRKNESGHKYRYDTEYSDYIYGDFHAIFIVDFL